MTAWNDETFKRGAEVSGEFTAVVSDALIDEVARKLAEAPGTDPGVIHTDAKGIAVWNALMPLVEQGVITVNEQLMLLVCLTHQQYPYLPGLWQP